jgi:hypothetical protein
MILFGATLLQSNGNGWETAASVGTIASGAVVLGSGVLMRRWNTQTFAALAESEETIKHIRERYDFD